MQFEKNRGRRPTEMPPGHKGYDVESFNGDGNIERYIEVKSLPDIRSAHRWKAFGLRLLVLAVLTAIAFVAAGTVVIGLFRDAYQDGAPGRALLAFVLVAGWAGVALAYRRLLWAGFWFRVRLRLASFQRLASDLANNWPRESGVLPLVGKYTVDERYPDLLLCGDISPKFAFREQVCPFVHRGSAGRILFEFWHPERRLEFFPQGGQPQSFVDVFGVSHQLLGARRLGEIAYLTWYSISGGPFGDDLDSPTDGSPPR